MDSFERERLRQRGQFWTPQWLARPMVEYVLGDKACHLFDPAVGTGAFFYAARHVAAEQKRNISLHGVEIDPKVLAQGILEGTLQAEDLRHIMVGDFFLAPTRSWQAIVANPPFVRHHRLTPEQKRKLRTNFIQHTGFSIDGRAGLHVYFFVHALSLLSPNGRLAFILPADVCEGRFATMLWRWIANRFAVEAVLTFSPDASPFPEVDVNPLVLFISQSSPKTHLSWAVCHSSGVSALRDWVRSGFEDAANPGLEVQQRPLEEALSTGLSRAPVQQTDRASHYSLADFAQVRRGIATGANDFFFLTKTQLQMFNLPMEFTVRAVGRTRDVPGFEITETLLASLEQKDRPTYLLSLDDRPRSLLPQSVQDYLRLGEQAGLHKRPLIALRNPWYRMERREPPPILFAYLGRRNARFILNSAGVVPLTGFLCIYPKPGVDTYALWRVLNHPQVLGNLSFVGKSYGSGAVKVEPRALERLQLPKSLCQELGVLQHDLFAARLL